VRPLLVLKRIVTEDVSGLFLLQSSPSESDVSLLLGAVAGFQFYGQARNDRERIKTRRKEEQAWRDMGQKAKLLKCKGASVLMPQRSIGCTGLGLLRKLS